MKTFEILLVEDNQSYVSLMMEALEECQVPTNLSVVMDGAEAMAFVRREGKYIHSPRSDLIILDLNIPKKKGQKVLEAVSYTHLRAHETVLDLVCRLLLEKKNK